MSDQFCVSNGNPKMTLGEFRQSRTANHPPNKPTPALAGLWWVAKGD